MALLLALATPAVAATPTVGGYLDGLAVVPTEHGERQQPQGLLDAWLEGDATPWLHGRLELRGRLGGPFEGGGGADVYDFDHTFQNHSPGFDAPEAWVEARGTSAELRVGLQRFAWGKLDGVPPTDIVNPRDYHDPVVQDFEERKLGIPAVTGTYYLPDVASLRLSGVRAVLAYIPFAVPPHLALLEERWFPSSIAPESDVPVGPLKVPLDSVTVNHRPPRTLDAGGIAFRLGGTFGESDWDVYHYSGPETAPDLAAIPFAYKPARGPIAVLTHLTQEHDTIHMTGADWSTALGPFTFRGEGAWFLDRPYLLDVSQALPQVLRQFPPAKVQAIITDLAAHPHKQIRIPFPPLFPNQDSVEWGFGADALWNGFQPLVQINQTILTDSHPPLLIHNPETRLTGLVRRQFLQDRLELELRTIYLVERGGFVVYPRATYRMRDDVRLRLGYLAVGGPRASYIGQFRDNDEVVMEARYTF